MPRATLCSLLLMAFAHLAFSQVPDLGYTGFNCPNAMPSSTVPTDVNRVRPGDIRVIAALGDSLTASMGAGATQQAEYYLDYRGVSYAIGGDDTLEQHVSLPNILKKVNPQLFGQSRGIGYVQDWNSAQLNAAIDGQKAEQLLAQARDLVGKIIAHGGEDMQTAWKLITIFVGTNDINALCNDGDLLHSPYNYSLSLQQTITILQQNLPKTIVSLVSMMNWEIWEKTYAHGGCPQTASFLNKEVLPREDCDRHATVRGYQQAVMDIQNSGMFDRPDFTVVVQPFWVDLCEPALRANGTTDPTFWSIDCFHYSTKANAIIAKMLWNNLMQPVGQKSTSYNLSDPSFPLQCPDAACPYIRTVQNSRSCS